MQKNSNLKTNFILNASYQFFTILIPLILAPYVCRVLGVEPLGTYSFTAANVSFFALFAALGTIIYGNREISFVQSDPKKYSKTFWEIEILSVVSTLVCLVVYLGFVYINQQYTALYLIQIFTFLSVAGNIAWFFQGLENFKIILVRNMFFKLVSVGFIFIFIKSEKDLLLYVAGLVILELVGNLSLWLSLPKYLQKVPFKELKPFAHFKPTLLLFVPTIMSSIYTILDKAMLGFFTHSKAENGYYEESMKLTKTALSLALSVETVMLPRISALYSEGKIDELKDLLYKSYRLVCMITMPLCFGIIAVAEYFVPIYYGPKFLKVSDLLCIQAFLIPIIGFSNVTGIQYLVTTKQDKKLVSTITVGAVINTVVNLILIPSLYSIGASIASVCAEGIIVVLQLFLVRKEISTIQILKDNYKYLLSAAGMFGTLFLAKHIIHKSIIGIILLVILGAGCYGIFLLLLRDSFLLENLKSILKKIKERR